MKTNNKDKMIEEAVEEWYKIPPELRHSNDSCLRQILSTLLTKHEEAVVERERKAIKKILTTKLDLDNMLEGWERYWIDTGDGDYIEQCIECENSLRILQALTPNNPTSDNK